VATDGTIYVGSSGSSSNGDNGILYAVNPKDGSQKWIYGTGKPIKSSPAIGKDGTIYIGGGDTKTLIAVH
jgi:outer membrane protein assembly factor BamB